MGAIFVQSHSSSLPPTQCNEYIKSKDVDNGALPCLSFLSRNRFDVHTATAADHTVRKHPEIVLVPLPDFGSQQQKRKHFTLTSSLSPSLSLSETPTLALIEFSSNSPLTQW